MFVFKWERVRSYKQNCIQTVFHFSCCCCAAKDASLTYLFLNMFVPKCVLCFLVGLTVSEAAKLCSYMHFREPKLLLEKTLLQKANLDKSIDFMDTLEEDIPKGV